MLDVLVVDDSDLIRAMILRTLKMAQVPIGAAYQAGNGKEALGILDENWVDLVLADINMPVMDGMEMVRRIRDRPDLAGIPVIIVSTEGAASRIEELESMGIVAYLRKPFTPEKLRDVVTGVTSDWAADDHERLLSEVFQLVLEQFTFMYGEQTEKVFLPDPGEQLLLARMTFTGAQGGAMALAAPAALAGEMASNVLADPGGDLSAIAFGADALGEVLNMACGHLTTSLEKDAGIDLSPPAVSHMTRAEWDELLSAAHTAAFMVEDHPVLLSLGVR